MRSRTLRAYAFSSVALTALGAPALAQAQAADSAQLEEVVVTAQKRQQRLQDVPVSVTALPAESLVANRITSVRDLDAVAPNLTVRFIVGGNLLPNYTIRGLVSLGSALGSDKGVAVYLDGVYLGSANGSAFDIGEIERIEVLRGPQGTLFGRNSTGGAISITTPDPSGQFGVKQRFTLGNRDHYVSSTTLNLPEAGPFSASLSYTHSEQRGDVRNLGAGTVWDFTPANNGERTTYTSPKYLGGRNFEAVAAKVKFQPNDRLNLVYRFDWSDEDLIATASGVIYETPAIRAIVAAQPNQALMTQLSRKRPDAVNNAGIVPSHVKNYGHALTAVYEVADNITLKNIAAYRYMKFSAPWQEFSGYGGLINTGAPVFAGFLGPALAASTVGAPLVIQTASINGYDHQWSDELQLNIDTTLATLTTGLLYFEQKSVRGPEGVDAGLGRARSSSFAVFPGFLVPYAGQPIFTRGRPSTVYTYSKAAFAQGEFHVTEQLDVVAGARYTKDTKKGLDQSVVTGLVSATFPLYYKQGKWTYNLGFNYKLQPDILLYGKYSTGYISGGSLATLTYQPETAKSWEGGIKADWLNRTLRTNFSIFDVKYGEVQASINGRALIPPQPQISQALISLGDAKATGFEFEGTFLPIRQVTLMVGVGYTDFKWLRLNPVIANANSEYLAANRPKWTVSLSGQYTSEPLFDDVTLTARMDGNWKSKTSGVPGIPLISASFPASEAAAFKAAQVIKAYWLVNARVALQGFKIGGADATLALWGRNLLNDRSISYPGSLVTMIAANYETARSYGLDLSVEF
jgi:iron complex outermembrane receptor protein